MWRLAFLLGACSVGGGPVVGYGQRGFVLGVEAGGGPAGIQAVGGYERGLSFGRLDFTDSGVLTSLDGATHGVQRYGLGAGFTTSMHPDGEERSWHLVATAGAGLMRSTRDVLAQCRSSNIDAHVFSASVALRWAGGFELVVLPRYEQVLPFCP